MLNVYCWQEKMGSLETTSREPHGGVITPVGSGTTWVQSPALSLTSYVTWFSYLTSQSLIPLIRKTIPFFVRDSVQTSMQMLSQ